MEINDAGFSFDTPKKIQERFPIILKALDEGPLSTEQLRGRMGMLMKSGAYYVLTEMAKAKLVRKRITKVKTVMCHGVKMVKTAVWTKVEH